MTTSESTLATLTPRQLAIASIAALAAVGDIARLGPALNRSLNALGELMKVVDARKQRGLQDVQGQTPVRPIPRGDALLAAGTANQTRLIGAPAKGPLFDFAPAADEYLKSHLFGDIFERDNLDWQSREVATVGMLSAMQGVEPQLQSHVAISLNVGISADQVRQVAQALADDVDVAAGTRIREALERQLAAMAGQSTDRR
jgi:4-carboxymuconolactone decarboxylase